MLHQKLPRSDNLQTNENRAKLKTRVLAGYFEFPANPEVLKTNQGSCALRGKIPEHMPLVFF